MVCSYRSSCIDLPVTIVDFQMKGYESRVYHVCQGGYVAMYEIDNDRAEFNICRDCLDEIWMGGKPEKSNKVQHRTVYSTEKSEED